MTSQPIKPSYDKIKFPGKIHLITNNQELAVIAPALKSATALGFDTETRASFKVGEIYQVALLQLATEHEAYLVRLHGITEFHSIKGVFEDPNILKVGAAIRDDIKALQKLFKFTPENFIELQTVAKNANLKNLGLRGMTEEVLQASLSKRAKTSNWEVKQLSADQIMYAATDAWIGLKLYQTINSKVSK
ncbi:MAG: 3'-5' exonuclease domain-containing protein 2 [Bdellovibrionales bacterium]|nr:3'-5' exonuclease domain-containing protein 2 [Bdellovibrionales bacterium]